MPRKSSGLDSARLEQMERDLQAVTSDAASLRLPIWSSQRRVKRKLAQPQPWCLAGFLLHTMLILYYLGPYSPRLPLPYLHFTGKAKDWPEITDEELTALIETAFLDAPAKLFLELCDPVHPSDDQAYQAALDFRSQFETMQWCEEMNTTKGLAPSSATILHRLYTDNEARPQDFQRHIPMNTWVSTPRTFVHKWRRRFGGRFGCIRIVPNLTAESMMAKVNGLVLVFVSILPWKHGAVLGPDFRPFRRALLKSRV